MRSFRPNEGVIWPLRIAATPDMMGNLKSKILGSTFVISNCCSASVVATPSVVSLLARMSSNVSPFASRTPTCLQVINVTINYFDRWAELLSRTAGIESVTYS